MTTDNANGAMEDYMTNIKDVVLNTLIFVEDLKAGKSQLAMLQEMKAVGYKKAEVRREFLNLATEPKQIGSYAKENGMDIFYSVPEKLYTNGELNAKQLETYFKEAQEMTSRYIKIIIGEYTQMRAIDGVIISGLCEKYNINLSVENDQTPENGKCAKILAFLQDCQANVVNVGMTFDTGNWLWVAEDPVESARILSKFVTYIHIKDILSPQALQMTMLGEGSVPMADILQALPKGLPTALEYPMDGSFETIDKESEKLMKIASPVV